jgi:hypothetical protein
MALNNKNIFPPKNDMTLGAITGAPKPPKKKGQNLSKRKKFMTALAQS